MEVAATQLKLAEEIAEQRRKLAVVVIDDSLNSDVKLDKLRKIILVYNARERKTEFHDPKILEMITTVMNRIGEFGKSLDRISDHIRDEKSTSDQKIKLIGDILL